MKGEGCDGVWKKKKRWLRQKRGACVEEGLFGRVGNIVRMMGVGAALGGSPHVAGDMAGCSNYARPFSDTVQ